MTLAQDASTQKPIETLAMDERNIWGPSVKSAEHGTADGAPFHSVSLSERKPSVSPRREPPDSTRARAPCGQWPPPVGTKSGNSVVSTSTFRIFASILKS